MVRMAFFTEDNHSIGTTHTKPQGYIPNLRVTYQTSGLGLQTTTYGEDDFGTLVRVIPKMWISPSLIYLGDAVWEYSWTKRLESIISSWVTVNWKYNEIDRLLGFSNIWMMTCLSPPGLIITFLVGDPELNLHVPLLLGGVSHPKICFPNLKLHWGPLFFNSATLLLAKCFANSPTVCDFLTQS